MKKVYKLKRKFVYVTNRQNDSNLDVVKRRQISLKNDFSDASNDSLSEEDRSSTHSNSSSIEENLLNMFDCEPLNRMTVSNASLLQGGKENSGLSAEDEATTAIHDYSKCKKTSSDLWPSVKLKQTVDVDDIEHIKRENNKGIQDSEKLLLDAEASMLVDSAFHEMDPNLRVRSVSTDPKEQQLKKLAVRTKYEELYNIPRVLYLTELVVKIQPLLLIVRDMYKGVVDSYYKFEATSVAKISQKAFLSMEEFRSLNIKKFLAGYYGLKRQLRVGEEILKHYKSFLLKRQGDTMKWWGVTDFANYVLAPEVLTSLCIQEMKLGNDIYHKETREQAYEILDKTGQFGLVVADSDPLESWEIVMEEERLRELGLNPQIHLRAKLHEKD